MDARNLFKGKLNLTLALSLLAASLMVIAPAVQAALIYGSPATNSQAPLTRYDTDTDMTETLATVQGNMGLAFDANDNLYGIRNDTLYSLDPDTGVQTVIGTHSEGIFFEALTIDLSGRLITGNNGQLFEVNPSDGSATSIGPVSGVTGIDGLTTAPVDVNTSEGLMPAGTLFSIDNGRLYAIDLNTLTATQLFSNVDGNETIAFGADGTLYGNDTADYYIIDLETGASTLLGGPAVWGSAVLGSLSGGVTPEPRATFEVNKTFNDGNTAEVEVTISCNTGLPLQQSDDISPGDGVDFVVVDFADGEMDCTVTETSGPDGYTVTYFDGSTTSGDGCSFEDVPWGGDFSCRVDNELDRVDIDVTKVWIDENPQFNAQNIARARWSCSSLSDVCEGVDGCNTSGFLNFSGDMDTESFSVFPDWDTGTTCSITEVDLFESGIEVDDSECQGLTVFPDTGASCTIYNTRLYEGIPTLSQYGLGLLALLMLGVGMIAFRRMA